MGEKIAYENIKNNLVLLIARGLHPAASTLKRFSLGDAREI